MFDKILEFLKDSSILGVENWRMGSLLVAVLAGLVVGRLVRFFIEMAGNRLKRRTEDHVLGMVLDCLAKPASFLCFALALRGGFAILALKNTRLLGMSESFCSVLYAMAIGYAMYRLVDLLDHYMSRWASRTETKIDDMLVPMIRKSLRITIVIIIAVFVLQNVLDQDLTTILASLGVGGLAIALAAQDTIKNFFGSLMILLDKPFQIGDRVVIAGHDGPVEEVGFRTTKIRTLDGHLVTLPNSSVVNDTVRNISSRPYIKRVANITITYDTSPEKAERAVEIIREILDNHEGMDPEFPARVYFNDFGDWALNILVIYWYHPPEYWDYLAFCQKVNLEILRRCNEEGIDFAFPSQTLYLQNDDKRQLALRMLSEQAQAEG